MGSRGERSLPGLDEIDMGVSGELGGSLDWWVQAAKHPARDETAIRFNGA